MAPSRIRLVGIALIASALLLTLLGGVGATAATKGGPAAKALKALVRQTNALPRGAVPKAKRQRLVRAARHARRVARKRPCVAVRDLNRYRRVLARVRVKGGTGKRARRARNRLAALGPASLRASTRLLGTKATKRCGGGVKPSTREHAQVKVLESDVNSMHLQVQLPAVQFVPETGGGKSWTKLTLPDTDTPSAPGTPGIPVVSNKFAVPDGATVTVDQGGSQSTTMEGVEIFPAQPDPVDQDTPAPDFTEPPFATPPFTLDEKAYETDGLVPSKPADAGVLGNYRDLTIGGVQIPAAQYNPSDGTLKVFKSVDFTINFLGGTHSFSDELSSPWEQPARNLIATLLNSRIIDLSRIFVPRRCGEEMLVITNPATRPAADQFASAKRAQGMRTSVFETGAGTAQIGTTPAAIQTFIRGRLTAFLCVHPSYVTIMGDDDLVPTFAGINGIPSDLPYSMRNDTDELPDVAVGRFIGNDNAAIANAVTKVVNYENNPPTGPMLRRATIAAQFQDDDNNGTENRTFILFAETLRNGLVARGVTVDRIYQESPGNNPQKLNDGTDLPAALKKPTFGWNGTGAQVTTAWNEGRFLMVHRDHGWSDGWSHPGYGTADVQALTNGANLPVVMSINCSSAAYDYDETSFVGESLVKANGGSVGAFGDTRDSPTWHNTQIALGFADGLLPSILPGEGPALKQRTGNALITGKLRLAGLAPPSGPGIVGGDGSTRNELYLWHYFGDPSMQMRGGDPLLIFDPSLFTAVFKRFDNPGDGAPYHVDVTLPSELNGQAISLLQNGEVVGKAIAADGKASVPADFDNDNVNVGELKIAVEGDGAVPVTVPVEGETSMTQTCPSAPVGSFDDLTTSGTLSPGFAGANIIVKYTRPDGTTFERTTQTAANGTWSNTIEPNSEDPTNANGEGTWHVQARYEGDSSHAASLAPDCTFDAFDNG